MTNDSLKKWLDQAAEPANALAFAIRFADRSVCAKRTSPGYPVKNLEQSLRGLAETFQVLALHRSPAQRIIMAYEKARVFAAVRADGACLGLYMPVEDRSYTGAHFAALVKDFVTTS